MIRLAAAAGALVLGLGLAVPAMAADLALVIGNHDYTRAPDALSARADAEAVADALGQGGYEVILGTNLSRNEMRRHVAEFARRVDQADRAVVFYSGHALRAAGRSYLAPVNQGNDTLVEVMMDGVPLDLILQLAARGDRSVVFVDGAQLDGFTPRPFAEPGLAHIDPPEGVLVVSAAPPGRAISRRTSGQSEFGRAVVREFLSPGATVSEGVRGIGSPAWTVGDTDTSLALVPSGRDTGTTEPSPATLERRLSLTAMERRAIQESLTAQGYNTRGTEGVFGPGTRSAIRSWQRAQGFDATGYLTQDQVAMINRQGRQTDTGTGGPSPAQIESRLNLSVAERSWIQENLNTLGYDTRGTGGVFGSGSRTAIRNWQRANDLEETGYLTQEQVAAINRQAQEARAGAGVTTAAEIEARLNLTGAERSQIQEDLSRLGYDTRGTDGVFGPGSRTAIRNWQRANDFEETGYLTQEQLVAIQRQAQQAGTEPAPDAASAEAQLDLARTDRLSIEQRLAHLGFPPGPQDGFFDERTRRAIENYQASRGYPATGYLDRQTLRAIVDETQGVRTGIVTGAQVLFDILEGLAGQD